MNIQKTTLLHLSLIIKLGPGAIQRLCTALQSQNNNLEDIYSYSLSDIKALGFSENTALVLYDGLRDTVLLDHELRLIKQHDVTVITWYEDAYPALLKTIHLPPVVIYVQGTIPIMPYVGFVGARLGDRYGYDVIAQLVPSLVSSGVGIVSGGAAGIDTFAHQATLDAGGVTVVVLGGGLLRPYPTSNKKLFMDVSASGGAVISSFPLLAEPLPGQFPARNRIIAGVAKMTVVVQAAAKSGALITAEYALQEGRSVGAVPGVIDNPLSAGCHALIGQGARLITCAEDILEECSFAVDRVKDVQMSIVDGDAMVKKSVPVFDTDVREKLFLEKKDKIERQDEKNPLLLHCLKPVTSSELSLAMGVSEQVMNDMLFDLQLEGKVEQDFAGLWQKV